MKYLFFILLSCFSYSNEVRQQLNVSASIVYDCSKNDEKAKKYCDTYVLTQQDNQITITY